MNAEAMPAEAPALGFETENARFKRSFPSWSVAENLFLLQRIRSHVFSQNGVEFARMTGGGDARGVNVLEGLKLFQDIGKLLSERLYFLFSDSYARYYGNMLNIGTVEGHG